jgi:alpha-mannosidase
VDGPQAIVQQVYAYGSSMLTQEVVLTTGSRVLEFRTTVDWRETERMLRSSFPVAVRADEATFEIQFGSLRRPTHCNTTWDLARFEVCAQKWVDISERAYGVALLNDCKYGHQVRENVIDIDLLRSPCSPDPTADRAVHQFTYALYPHAGDHVVGGVSRAAYELNVPLRVLEAPGTVDGRSFLTVDAPNVIVEAVKKAEDSDRIIVRLYEANGASVTARISLPEGASTAELVDLMEENPAALPVRDGAAELAFGPFEVHTLRIG